MNDKQSRISVKHRELDIRRFTLALLDLVAAIDDESGETFTLGKQIREEIDQRLSSEEETS